MMKTDTPASDRSCQTCRVFVPGAVLDDAPSSCWDCVSHPQVHLPGWVSKAIPASDRYVTSNHNGGPQLIGLSGPAGSGKSTAAEILIRELGASRVKFADPLKDMLRSFYETAGLSEEEIEERIEGGLKEAPCAILRGRTPRHAMQTLGTEWGREAIAHDLWIAVWKRRVGQLLALGFSVVCDDVRFQNEADALRSLGGYVIRIHGRTPVSDTRHASEAQGFYADEAIRNDGSLEDLRTALEPFIFN